MHGEVLELRVSEESEKQAEGADEQTDHEQRAAVDPAKECRLAEVRKHEIGLAAALVLHLHRSGSGNLDWLCHGRDRESSYQDEYEASGNGGPVQRDERGGVYLPPARSRADNPFKKSHDQFSCGLKKQRDETQPDEDRENPSSAFLFSQIGLLPDLCNYNSTFRGATR